jgi:hypothetical protein
MIPPGDIGDRKRREAGTLVAKGEAKAKMAHVREGELYYET